MGWGAASERGGGGRSPGAEGGELGRLSFDHLVLGAQPRAQLVAVPLELLELHRGLAVRHVQRRQVGRHAVRELGAHGA
eukprot:6711801-Prymnesium_polylepis.1